MANDVRSEDEGTEQDIWDPTAAHDSPSSQDDSDQAFSNAPDANADSASADASESEGSADLAQEGEEGGAHDDSPSPIDDGGKDADDASDEGDASEDEQAWEELAKQVEVDLETFSKDWGFESGGFMRALSVANRKRYDYSTFLRQFTALSEEMKINDDEFDYVFYTYGLELYGNMPLIEPLEYKETHRIRDFAICIDTSESCDGDLVRAFVEHTFSMLKRQQDYAHKVRIHVIQCDSRVQSDLRIDDLRDVDKLMENFTIRGLGGTDFRPAFAYVNDLVAQGELPHMKGIIYFTDGLGAFPDKAPGYDVAFVFMDDGSEHVPKVPPWAMRVLIDETDIDRMTRGSH